MYNTEDILKRLQAGEATDSIANEIADALNKLAEQYTVSLNEAKAIQAKQEAEKRAKAASKEQAKTRDAKALAEMVSCFMDEYYPELCPKDERPFCDGKDVIELIDICVNVVDKIDELVDNILPEVEAAINPKTTTKGFTTQTKNPDVEIKQFLKSMGLA